ncbi:hypothetical protein V6Z12_A04G092400 [Gossypium hirsutum]
MILWSPISTICGMHGTLLLKFAFLNFHHRLRIVMQSFRYDHGCSSFNSQVLMQVWSRSIKKLCWN